MLGRIVRRCVPGPARLVVCFFFSGLILINGGEAVIRMLVNELIVEVGFLIPIPVIEPIVPAR